MAEPIVNVVGVASIPKVFLLDCIRWYQIPVERIQFHCTGLELYLGQAEPSGCCENERLLFPYNHRVPNCGDPVGPEKLSGSYLRDRARPKVGGARLFGAQLSTYKSGTIQITARFSRNPLTRLSPKNWEVWRTI